MYNIFGECIQTKVHSAIKKITATSCSHEMSCDNVYGNRHTKIATQKDLKEMNLTTPARFTHNK